MCTCSYDVAEMFRKLYYKEDKRTSKVLRKEFPHLKEWCEIISGLQVAFHDSVDAGLDVVEKYISAHNTYEHNRK